MPPTTCSVAGSAVIVPFDGAAVDDIAARLDLRDPNRRAVEAVARHLDSDPPGVELVCDLATATGKTFIAAGVIDYLAAAGVRNVLIVCPGTTILRKTVDNLHARPRQVRERSRGPPDFATRAPRS